MELINTKEKDNQDVINHKLSQIGGCLNIIADSSKKFKIYEVINYSKVLEDLQNEYIKLSEEIL